MKGWAEDPIVIPRWVLAVKYLTYILIGAAVSAATAPSLEAVTSEWYSTIWGVCVAACGLVALLGSVHPTRWVVEAVGCGGIVSFMAVYAVSPIIMIIDGDTDRLAYSVLAVAFAVIPAGRLWQLLRGGVNA